MLVAAPESSCGAVVVAVGCLGWCETARCACTLTGSGRRTRRPRHMWFPCCIPVDARRLAETSIRSVGVFGCWGQLQGGGEVGADAGRFFGGGDDPLIEGGADAAALGLIVDLDEAHEIASGGQAARHGILVRQHAVEDEGHVVVFEELGDGQHAGGVPASGFRLRLRRCRTVIGAPTRRGTAPSTLFCEVAG